MEDFAAGMLAGAATLATVLGLIKFGLWCGKTENRIAMVEAQFKAWTKLFQVRQGVKNDDRKVVGAEPAGPATPS